VVLGEIQTGADTVKNIHVETASDAPHERPVLAKLLAQLQKGDVLMTFKLDGLGRSLAHLVKVLEDLEARGRPAAPPASSCCSARRCRAV
jgi:DNA invertase Pin-like site-specific DNA recombinase